MDMKNFCREFTLQAINITEFVLENDSFDELFLNKLSIIKFAINHHIDECETCEAE